MPDPVPIVATPVYVSNFSSDTDGWSLNTQGGAAGDISTSGGKLNVSITNAGTEGWHVQLVRNNIPLHQDKMYRISFKAQATADRTTTFYAGRASDPWNAYSGYNGASIGTSETIFSASFTMTNPTDLASRLVFDLGLNASGVTITEVKVEELQFVVTAVNDETPSPRKPRIHPNPVATILYCDDLTNYRHAKVYDMSGQLMAAFDVSPQTKSINLQDVPQGLYVLKLSGNLGDEYVRVVKQ
jgi:hypothetical protein